MGQDHDALFRDTTSQPDQTERWLPRLIAGGNLDRIASDDR